MKSMTGRRFGFTLVEIMVVLVVGAIIIGVTVVSFGTWRERMAENEVKHDLSNGASSLQNQLNFESSYPNNQQAFNDIYTNSENVSLTYTLRTDGSYCLNGQSTLRSNVRLNIDSRVSKTDPQPGHCSGA